MVAVARIYEMEQSVLHGCLLTDDMGLGKTLTALILVHLSLSLDLLQHPPAAACFKPTLIACPSSAFGTWKAELAKFFPHATRKYFMGSSNKGSVIERSHVLSKRSADLRAYVKGLDPHNPETARVIVLTTYMTWLKRTIYQNRL